MPNAAELLYQEAKSWSEALGAEVMDFHWLSAFPASNDSRRGQSNSEVGEVRGIFSPYSV